MSKRTSIIAIIICSILAVCACVGIAVDQNKIETQKAVNESRRFMSGGGFQNGVNLSKSASYRDKQLRLSQEIELNPNLDPEKKAQLIMAESQSLREQEAKGIPSEQAYESGVLHYAEDDFVPEMIKSKTPLYAVALGILLLGIVFFSLKLKKKE